MVGHAMPTTFVGHCWRRMTMFIIEGCKCLLMAKRSRSLPPTMFWMGSIAVVLAFSKVSWQSSVDYKGVLGHVQPGCSVAVIISYLP